MPAAILKTIFSADTTQVQKGLARLKSGLRDVRNVASSVGGMLAGALAVGGLREMVNDFDRIGKLANRLNVSTDTMQKLSYAADLAGADVEQVAKAMTRATIAGQDAADGLTTMQRAFDDLGINVEEFNQLSPEDQLKAVSDAFNASGQSSEAYAAVLKILGTRAQELIPLLKEMSDTMDKAPIVSPEAIQGAQDFNDALTHIKTELMAIAGVPLGKLSEWFKEYKQFAEDFGEKGLGGALDASAERHSPEVQRAQEIVAESIRKGAERGAATLAARGKHGSIPASRPTTSNATGMLLSENPFALDPEEYARMNARAEVGFARMEQGQDPYGGGLSGVSSLAAIGGGGGVGGGTLERQLREAKTTNDQLKPVSKWAQMQLNRGNANAEFRLLP